MDASFMQSAKCRLLLIIITILAVMELLAVYRWESMNNVSQPNNYVMIMTHGGRDKEHHDRDKGAEINNLQSLVGEPEESLVTQKTKDIFLSKTVAVEASERPRHEKTGETNELHNYTDEKESEPMNMIHRLPSGKVRLTEKGQDQLDRRLKLATDKKIILIWIPMFGMKNDHIVSEERCGNCEVTYDRNMIDDTRTGAVLFHFDALRADTMPKNRNLNQFYIYWDAESTATLKVVRGHSLKWEDSFKFNGTMNYRLDSSIYQSYEKGENLVNIIQSNAFPLDELLKLKTKTAIAIVSNCNITPGARTRLKMLKELLSFNFGLEGYGGCLPGGRNFPPNRNSNEFINRVRTYKFYFSFENSYHCKDYITEKFFNNALRSLAVPVVWGTKKEDYEAVAPVGSFIYADDFSSMRELADYLQKLDKNNTAYLEYFKWLTMPPSVSLPQYGRAMGFCQICRILHGINVDDIYSPKFDEINMERPLFTDGISRRSVDLINWFYGEENPECFSK